MQSQTFGFSVEVPLENKQPTPTNATFDEAILQAVDTAFSILGEAGAQTVFEYLEQRCAMNRTAIPKDVAQFSKSLEALFGQAANLIEIQIMRALHQKFPSFNYQSQKGKLSFAEYVEALHSFCR
jgi:hypothetical protein